MNNPLPAAKLGACALLTVLLAACAPAPTPAPPGNGSTSTRQWQDENIYFALTDRFSNGDRSNDNGSNRDAGDRADLSNPLAWHGGDFKGLTAKIQDGYFKRLGVTALWVSPVVLQVPAIVAADKVNKGKYFAGYHGYWAEDFKTLDPHFGSLEDFKALVAAAHTNNIKIIQDVVLNHTGYGAALTKTNPEWFHTEADCTAATNKDTDCALAGLPDFKQDVPAVTTYLNEFIRYWRTLGIDGLRIDTMKHVPDSYWQQFFAAGGAGDAAKLWSVGEVFNGDPNFVAKYLKLGSPSAFDFPLYFAVKDNLSSAGGNAGALGDIFAQDGAYPDASRLTTFIDNHDVTRFVTEVTNRGGSAPEAQQRLDLALSLLYTVRGTPSIYQGTEIAQPGKGDPYDYPLGESNREDLGAAGFAAAASSPTAARIAALAGARAALPALRRGTQQELYRSSGLYAYRRVGSGNPVVVVLNNSDAAQDLSKLPGGGLALLGTFGGSLSEVTGRSNPLSLSGGNLVGSVPPRTALILTGSAGASSGGAAVVNPALPEVAGLSARPGDGAVGLSWTASSDAAVSGYRIYVRAGDGSERLLNFAPLPASTTSYVARGLSNDVAYTFRVVTVDSAGKESSGSTASATPSTAATTSVSFTVDARTQGNGPVELRRFDTGAQIVYPMTQTSRGIWKTSIALPLYRDIKFKFGNAAAGAKNSGYEAPGQGDRSLNTGTSTAYSGTYDYIDRPVPTATIEGKVTSGGQPVSGALLEASGAGADAQFNYAYTFADGSYTLLANPGSYTLNVSAAAYLSGSVAATAPGSASLELKRDLRTKYTIDGDLSDWTAPAVTLNSPQPGVFGADNNWLTLKADSDNQYLYLAYTYRVSGNSAILYLGTGGAAGATQADSFEAWKRAATFSTPVNFFLARYGNEAPQLRRVASATSTPEIAAGDYLQASRGTLPDQTVEVAIPWSALGLSGKPAGGLNLYGGIFGGDGYGAGDIVPDAGSTPAGANRIGTDAEQRRATFTQGLRLP